MDGTKTGSFGTAAGFGAVEVVDEVAAGREVAGREVAGREVAGSELGAAIAGPTADIEPMATTGSAPARIRSRKYRVAIPSNLGQPKLCVNCNFWHAFSAVESRTHFEKLSL